MCPALIVRISGIITVCGLPKTTAQVDCQEHSRQSLGTLMLESSLVPAAAESIVNRTCSQAALEQVNMHSSDAGEWGELRLLMPDCSAAVAFGWRATPVTAKSVLMIFVYLQGCLESAQVPDARGLLAPNPISCVVNKALLGLILTSHIHLLLMPSHLVPLPRLSSAHLYFHTWASHPVDLLDL